MEKITAWDGEHKTSYQKNSPEKILELTSFAAGDGIRLPIFTFPLLAGTGLVIHGFTTRQGGISEGMFSSLNLSFARGDRREAVEENFRRLSAALGVEYGSYVFSDQAHTANVVRVGKEDAGNGILRGQRFSGVDGMVTDEPGVTLATFHADCAPLYFLDPAHRAIGLGHSGWRGTVGRMGRAMLEAMGREFHTRPQDVLCAIGPSICRDCYEVGGDVAEEFRREFAGREDEILLDAGDGKYRLDLWRANQIVLLDAGVEQEHLAVTNVCTCCNSGLLFSHRATKGRRGNLAAVLALR